MKRLLSFAVLALLLCSCAPPRQSLLAEQALCLPIGLEGRPMELCVLNIENRSPYYRSNLYYLVSDSGIQEVEGLGGGFQTFDLLPSPSLRYLAVVEDAGEGHPYFSVWNLYDIREGASPRSTHAIEAYPSGFFDLHWQGDELAFKTDTDLMPPEGRRAYFDEENTWSYLLHPESDTLEQVGEPVPID